MASSYDLWLEAPYQRAAAQGEAFEYFEEDHLEECEDSECDHSEQSLWEMFYDWQEQAAEDAAVSRWEAAHDW